MTKEEIIKEIESFDTTNASDGLSFCESFESTHNLRTIEQVLYYCRGEKYYYNYSEKRLRHLIIDLKEIAKQMLEHPDDDAGVLMYCPDVDKEEDDLHIMMEDFSDKVICYEDLHKVITHDPKTKHYECFFIDLPDEKIKDFFKTVHDRLPKELKDIINFPELKNKGKTTRKRKTKKKEVSDAKLISSDETIDEDMLEAACQIISQYLMQRDNEYTGIKFTLLVQGVKIDLLTSRIYDGEQHNGNDGWTNTLLPHSKD